MDTDIARLPEDATLETAGNEWSLQSKLIAAGILVVIALVSAFVLSGIFSSPDTYTKTIESLDDKRNTVLTLTATTAGVSAALSAIPDDTCTPLAENIADLADTFLMVLAAILLEKYLLTTFGFAAFAILIPLSCALLIAALFIKNRPDLEQGFSRLAMRLALFGIALAITVPGSVFVTDRVEDTYKDSIESTLAAAQETTEEAEAASAEAQEATNEDEGFIGNLVNGAQDAAHNVLGGFDELIEKGKALVGKYLEAAAVMIVTSLIMPILVLVFFIWLVQTILGINVNVSPASLNPRGFARVAGRHGSRAGL